MKSIIALLLGGMTFCAQANELTMCIGKAPVHPGHEIVCTKDVIKKEDLAKKGTVSTTTLKQLYKDGYKISHILPPDFNGAVFIYLENK